MATINITVQSLLNAAQYDPQTVDTAGTIGELKDAMVVNFGYRLEWFDLVFNDAVLDTANTIASYGIIEGSSLRTHNKISRLATRELRQKAKLDLAALDRDSTGNPRATLDLTTLPTQYDDDTVVDNPNLGGLVEGRPWIETVSTFTFYEAIGSVLALSTTQYVKGNKIYVYSSSFDVPSYQNARVVVNDIEVLNQGNGTATGHHMIVLDSYGNVISTQRYDTYDPTTGVANLTALASALGSVASGNIVVLTVYDASALNAGVRTALTTGYGSTNSNTWTARRYDHIFIGIRS
jgi:hypothetical protein